MVDLNTLIPAGSSHVFVACSINDAGQILGCSFAGTCLLTPYPSANPQTISVIVGKSATITLTGADHNTPPLPLTYKVATGPSHGTLGKLSASTGVVVYTPSAGFQGADSFTFTVGDVNATSAPAIVTINVIPDVPVAAPQTVPIAHNTAKAITLTGTDPGSLPLTYAIKTSPMHGTLGTLNSATGAVTYTPSSNFGAKDSFTFTASNGTKTSAAATITLNVAAGTPTADPQTVAVAHNTTTKLTLAGTDPDSPALALTFAIVSKPTHGTLGNLNASTGAVSYSPTTNFQGKDSFTFTASNGTNKSATTTVSINVAPGVPTANAQTINVTVSTPVTITLTGSDLDSPALPLTFTIVTKPEHGTLGAVNTSTGKVTYTVQSFDKGRLIYTGTDSFTFTVSNGTFTSSPATVTLNDGGGE
jgi:hypothetical protein